MHFFYSTVICRHAKTQAQTFGNVEAPKGCGCSVYFAKIRHNDLDGGLYERDRQKCNLTVRCVETQLYKHKIT